MPVVLQTASDQLMHPCVHSVGVLLFWRIASWHFVGYNVPMSKHESPPKGLTALIMLGVVALVLFVCAAFAIPAFFRYRVFSLPRPAIDMTRLGEPGMACGGPERYPCKPGLVCSIPSESWDRQYGTCMTDADAPPPKDVGEPCVGDYQCMTDLKCITGPDSPVGTCEPFTPDSPPF